MLTRSMFLLLTAAGASVMALAADLPARKPGLWEITITSSNAKVPPLVEKVCLDPATDRLLYRFGAGASQKLCSSVDIHNAGGGKVMVDSQCRIGSRVATSHGTTTMNGDTAYHTESTIHYEPALSGKTDSTSTQDARWVGACPADMTPGDIEVAAGPMMPVPMKMNLTSMFKDE